MKKLTMLRLLLIALLCAGVLCAGVLADEPDPSPSADPHTHTVVTDAAVAATCTETGLTEGSHCSECGEVLVAQTTIEALGHTWNEGEVTTEPTCTEAGVKTYTCSVCGETKTEEIAALGHSWNEGVVTTEPTCTEAGVKTYTCTVCGETKTEEIAALGHDWDAGVVTKEATCTETGVRTYTCSHCGTTATEVIPMIPHDWDDGVITTEATCTTDGVKTYTCAVCGETRTETITAQGHQFDENGVCTVCGEGSAVARIGENTYTTLRSAVDAAANDDTIYLLKDIDFYKQYDGTTATANVGSDTAAAIDVKEKSITIDGGEENKYTIQRTGDYTGTFFNVFAEAALRLKNLTLDGGSPDWDFTYEIKTTNGYAPEKIVVTESGDGVYSTAPAIVNKGDLVLDNTVAQNFVTADANKNGAVIQNADGNVTIADSTIQHNWVKKAYGGAIYSTNGTLTVTDSTITENGSGGNGVGYAGGFAYLQGTGLTVSGSTFRRNFTGSNGGVFLTNNAPYVGIDDSQFYENIVGNDGGVTQTSIGVDMDYYYFRNSLFDGNIGLAQGNQSLGAVFYVSGGAGKVDVLFEDDTFIRNSAFGVIQEWNGDNTTVTVNRSTFRENPAQALYVANTTLTVNDSLFENTGSEQASGGAIRAGYLGGKTTVIVNNTQFKGNKGYNGGAIYTYADTTLTVNDSVIEDSSALYNGGAMYLNYGTNTTINNTTIRNNTAPSYGGAIRVQSNNSNAATYPDVVNTSLTLGNGTSITGNNAGALGGGLYITGSGIDTVTMAPGTAIYNNTADQGGDDIAIYGTADESSYTTIQKLVDASTMNGVTPDGYAIDGWYIDGVFDTEASAVTEGTRFVRGTSDEYTDLDTTVYAWTLLKAETGSVTITYVDRGNTLASVDVPKGDATPTIDNPRRSGYRFVGWTPVVAAVADADATYVARWAVIEDDDTPVTPVTPDPEPEDPEEPTTPEDPEEPIEIEDPDVPLIEEPTEIEDPDVPLTDLPTEIEDPDVPLSDLPTEIEEPEVPLSDLPTEIEEPEVPKADTPEVEQPTETKAPATVKPAASPAKTSAAPKADTVTIADEDVPLGATPYTGDESHTMIWVVLSLFALAGMGILFADQKRRIVK